MRKSGSSHISLTSPAAKTNSKNSSDETKNSSNPKKSDDIKKSVESTDHTTVSTSFCGCKKDKCDAFFDKLLNYLEKQSEVIARCCALSRKHRGPFEKVTTSDDEVGYRHPSPCRDEPDVDLRRRASIETERSFKGKGSKCKDSKEERKSAEVSRLQSTPLKIGDKACNIYVEVCSCQKGRKSSDKCSNSVTEVEPDRYSLKQNPRSQLDCYPNVRSNEYGFDCQGCEKKVGQFFKIAEEICQAYLKQCQEKVGTNRRTTKKSQSKGWKSSEGFTHSVPFQPSQVHLSNEGVSDDTLIEGVSTKEHPCSKPIAIEIECQGTKEEFIIEPCHCVERGNKSRPKSAASRVESKCPKKSCLEVFEERYGKMLRDLHNKFISNPNLSQSNYPPTGYQNPYGDYAPQQQPLQQPPFLQPQQQQPMQQPPLYQQQPSVQQMEQPLPQPSQPPAPDSSDDRKSKKKKKEKKNSK